MLGKQPDLLNKNFAIGYFIPSVIFLVGAYSVYIHLVDKVVISFDVLRKIQESSALVGTTLVALLSWTGGILLLAINRDIMRILEGYGVINPFRLLTKIIHIQKWSFRRLKRRKSELDKKRDNARAKGRDLCTVDRVKRREVTTRLAWRFPSSEEFVLPTSFGNAIRSFEVYPNDMYGVDSIPAWPRLYAVIPKDYREALDDAKALLDFWVNLWLASMIIILEYLLIAATNGLFNSSSIIFAGCLILASCAFYNRATASAIGWGSLVRSSFDLFLDDLRLKLGYPNPASPTRQREMWTSFSRAVFYADPESLPPRSK